MTGERDIQHYDLRTRILHWTTAGLVVTLWVMGRLTKLLPKGPVRLDIWSVHVLLGLLLAIVILTRIVWRLSGGRRLPPSEHGPRYAAAVTVHALLYVLLVGVAGLGVLNVLAHGFPLFGAWHFPKVGNEDYAKVVNGWHSLFANLIAATALVHGLAALFHRYILNDKVFARMWPGAGSRR